MVSTVSIDGFATFAMRAFLSLCFWAAFSLVTSRFCLLSSRAASEKFGLPDLVLVVLAQPNYNMQSCVDLRGYFVTPDRLHRSVAQFKEGNLVFTVAVSAV